MSFPQRPTPAQVLLSIESDWIRHIDTPATQDDSPDLHEPYDHAQSIINKSDFIVSKLRVWASLFPQFSGTKAERLNVIELLEWHEALQVEANKDPSYVAQSWIEAACDSTEPALVLKPVKELREVFEQRSQTLKRNTGVVVLERGEVDGNEIERRFYELLYKYADVSALTAVADNVREQAETQVHVVLPRAEEEQEKLNVNFTGSCASEFYEVFRGHYWTHPA